MAGFSEDVLINANLSRNNWRSLTAFTDWVASCHSHQHCYHLAALCACLCAIAYVP